MVRTGPGNPGKSWNFKKSFSRPWKSWNSDAGPRKSWKSELGKIFVKINALKFWPHRTWLTLFIHTPRFPSKILSGLFLLYHRPKHSFKHISAKYLPPLCDILSWKSARSPWKVLDFLWTDGIGTLGNVLEMNITAIFDVFLAGFQQCCASEFSSHFVWCFSSSWPRQQQRRERTTHAETVWYYPCKLKFVLWIWKSLPYLSY